MIFLNSKKYLYTNKRKFQVRIHVQINIQAKTFQKRSTTS